MGRPPTFKELSTFTDVPFQLLTLVRSHKCSYGVSSENFRSFDGYSEGRSYVVVEAGPPGPRIFVVPATEGRPIVSMPISLGAHVAFVPPGPCDSLISLARWNQPPAGVEPPTAGLCFCCAHAWCMARPLPEGVDRPRVPRTDALYGRVDTVAVSPGIPGPR